MLAIRRVAYIFAVIFLLAGAVFAAAVQTGRTLDVYPDEGVCLVYADSTEMWEPWWLHAVLNPNEAGLAAESLETKQVPCNLAEDPVPMASLAIAASPFLIPLILLVIVGPGKGPSRAERRAAKAAGVAAAAQVRANKALKEAETANAAAQREIES